MSVLKVKDKTTGEWKEIQSIQGPPGQVDGLLSLGIDQTDGLAYVYYNGIRQGTGIAVGGGSTTLHRVSNDLIHVETSNGYATIQNGLTYKAMLTPDKGYGNTTVIVTMGGVEVPNAYDAETGNITVTGVSDDLVITAVASLLPIDLLDVTWADHAISVGQSTNSYNAWSPHDMQYDDVHDKWLLLQSHANQHLNHTASNWTLSIFNPYDPTDVTDVPLPATFNGVGMLLVENGVWWLMCRGTKNVYRTSDEGASWEHFTAAANIPRIFGVYKLGTTYFAGDDRNNGITYFVSSDLVNWQTKSFDSSLGYDCLCETTFCEYNGRYWAFNRTNDEELGHPVILVSDDQGETWQLFSDQMLHGWRSTVSCLPFKNFIIIADIDRNNGYAYYSKFDGETVQQLKSWRLPCSGSGYANDDFHNINIATNYKDTIVMEFMHGVPYYRDTSTLYYDEMACDNVMLVGSTKNLPSLKKTVFASTNDLISFLNNNNYKQGLNPNLERDYRWRLYGTSNIALQVNTNGSWKNLNVTTFEDEIEIPKNLAACKDVLGCHFKIGEKSFKPWHNNYTAPNTGLSRGVFQARIAFVDIGGNRYVYGMSRINDLPVLIKAPFDYKLGNQSWAGLNEVINQEWQKDLPERKVFDITMQPNDSTAYFSADANTWALFEYVPVGTEES